MEGREHGQAPEYVLGALEAPERHRFEAHAARCPACRREMAELMPVADALALAVARADPPPELRTRILRQALREARPRGMWLDLSRLVWGRAAAALAAASLLVALGTGLWAAFTQQQLARQLQAQSTTIQQLSRMLDLVASTDMMERPLYGTEAAPQARARLYLNPMGYEALLLVSGLPVQPAEKAYQLWLIRDDQRSSGGLFTVDAQGRAQVLVRAPKKLLAFQMAGVTVEPAGGSPGPTGPRVLYGSLAEN